MLLIDQNKMGVYFFVILSGSIEHEEGLACAFENMHRDLL